MGWCGFGRFLVVLYIWRCAHHLINNGQQLKFWTCRSYGFGFRKCFSLSEKASFILTKKAAVSLTHYVPKYYLVRAKRYSLNLNISAILPYCKLIFYIQLLWIHKHHHKKFQSSHFIRREGANKQTLCCFITSAKHILPKEQ